MNSKKGHNTACKRPQDFKAPVFKRIVKGKE